MLTKNVLPSNVMLPSNVVLQSNSMLPKNVVIPSNVKLFLNSHKYERAAIRCVNLESSATDT